MSVIIGYLIIFLVVFFALLWMPKNSVTYKVRTWIHENRPEWLKLLPSYNRMFFNPRRWSLLSWLVYMEKRLLKELAVVNKNLNLVENIKPELIDSIIATTKDEAFKKKIIEVRDWTKSDKGQEVKSAIEDILRKSGKL